MQNNYRKKLKGIQELHKKELFGHVVEKVKLLETFLLSDFFYSF